MTNVADRHIRSLLFVPATRPDLVQKVGRFPADGVVIDLEDTVPAAEKARARASVRELLELLRSEEGRAPSRYVRVNPVGTEWFDEDMRCADLDAVDGLVVPKLSSGAELARVAECCQRGSPAGLPVIAGIETARGVAGVETLVSPPVAAVYFGAEDFVADMGGRRTPSGTEVHYARSRVALAARVGGVAALDQIVFDVRDEQGFRVDAEAGRAIGYTGKMCLHPDQVQWANQTFSPTVDELDWARRALAAHAESESRGQGVAVLDGTLVDMPMVRMARRIVADT